MKSATVIPPGQGEKYWIVGDLVHIPAGVWHGLRTTRGARVVDFHTPGGFEQFFDEAGVPCNDPTAPTFDPARARELILKHGMDLPGSR